VAGDGSSPQPPNTFSARAEPWRVSIAVPENELQWLLINTPGLLAKEEEIRRREHHALRAARELVPVVAVQV